MISMISLVTEENNFKTVVSTPVMFADGSEEDIVKAIFEAIDGMPISFLSMSTHRLAVRSLLTEELSRAGITPIEAIETEEQRVHIYLIVESEYPNWAEYFVKIER